MISRTFLHVLLEGEKIAGWGRASVKSRVLNWERAPRCGSLCGVAGENTVNQFETLIIRRRIWPMTLFEKFVSFVSKKKFFCLNKLLLFWLFLGLNFNLYFGYLTTTLNVTHPHDFFFFLSMINEHDCIFVYLKHTLSRLV